MLENLNELEKIGLAFISGLVAGAALENADTEVDNDTEKSKQEGQKNVIVGKLEGEQAENFMKFLKKLGVE